MELEAMLKCPMCLRVGKEVELLLLRVRLEVLLHRAKSKVRLRRTIHCPMCSSNYQKYKPKLHQYKFRTPQNMLIREQLWVEIKPQQVKWTIQII